MQIVLTYHYDVDDLVMSTFFDGNEEYIILDDIYTGGGYCNGDNEICAVVATYAEWEAAEVDEEVATYEAKWYIHDDWNRYDIRDACNWNHPVYVESLDEPITKW